MQQSFTYVGQQAQSREPMARIKVIGVGGGGGNAVDNMIDSDLKGVDFIAANTDAQALKKSRATMKIQLGEKLTEGLGAGNNPAKGRESALENEESIRNALSGSHMVFITAGFGGGTGTGAAPVIAEICKDLKILTVAVVTKPFTFEGKKRARQAEEGIYALKETADTVITIPNDRLRGISEKDSTMLAMFKKADEILLHSVKGITDLIMLPGLINLDFADVKETMSKAGLALMGIGVASGENRAVEAAERAISHPLLEDISVAGAKGVLMNITSTSALTMEEMTQASDRIYREVGEDADIIWGTAVDDTMGDEIRVTVIATGIGTEADSAMPEKFRDRKLRGKVRDLTPADLERAVNYDEPTFVRNKRAGDDPNNFPYKNYKGLVIDNSDLDIPTFLRRRAD
ncbi:MAG: cell division protein FtsZ [Desulfobacterales bacterium]